jgi:ArsR family transcriptional regulator
MKHLIKLLKAIGDPNRIKIMKMLQHREMCVCELREAIGISQPSVSRHLKLLQDADLLESRRDGLWINYRWNPEPSNQYAKALMDLIKIWLEEDEEIRSLILKSSKLNREMICKSQSRHNPNPSKREAGL